MNQSILCGIDSSQVSHHAARVAAALARELDHRLILAHIAHYPPTFLSRSWDRRQRELQRREATRDAAAMLERVAATVPETAPDTRVVFGEPAEALTAIARDEDASVLIVGSRGRGALAAAALGSVSARLASTGECPVMVVPSPDAADRFLAHTPGSHLVCGIDESRDSARALRVAAGLTDRLKLTLLAVHVDADGTSQGVPPGKPAPRLMVYGDDPIEGLRERALYTDASMIVVGSRGRGTWQAAALGTVSGALAATAPVPVLVVPPSARLPRLAEDVVDATVKDVLHRAQRRTMHRSHQAIETDHTRAQIAADRERVGRFSLGIEQLPETPAKLRRGRFSDGIERLPAIPDKLHRRRFSEGIEQFPETAATRRRGSFADGYEQTSPPRSNAA